MLSSVKDDDKQSHLLFKMERQYPNWNRMIDKNKWMKSMLFLFATVVLNLIQKP